jgi:signal transduction histidine kinase
MRIGSKLLLTYLGLIALISFLTTLGLNVYVKNQLIATEKARLDELVEKQANYMSERINAGYKSKSPAELGAAKQLLSAVEDLLVDDTLAFVDANCVIVRASKPAYQGKVLPTCRAKTLAPKALRRPQVDLGGVTVIISDAPLQVDAPALQGYSLAMIREMDFVNHLAAPIIKRITFVVLVGLIVALLVAGWISRELVKRIQDTGAAARALAEGDLARRLPEHGSDELADLAGHFNHMAERIQILVEGLRRSEQMRKELLVTVSHELRTPMTSISGFAEALRDGVVQGDERKQRYYEIIATESGRLTRLINDLFDVAKLEAGQLELRLQAMPVAPWLREFSEGMRPMAEAQEVRLELALTPEAEQARVYGDRDRLDQVLTNLVSNALRFAPVGTAIAVQARVDGPDLVVEVADQGPGLTADDAARVFDRFFQGHNKSPGHKGAGLGLAIVKSIVEAHGGSVGVTNTPGGGATFWIRIGKLA